MITHASCMRSHLPSGDAGRGLTSFDSTVYPVSSPREIFHAHQKGGKPVTKQMMACAKCGFIGVVEAGYTVELSGWLRSVADGHEQWCCPACRTDGACESTDTVVTDTQPPLNI